MLTLRFSLFSPSFYSIDPTFLVSVLEPIKNVYSCFLCAYVVEFEAKIIRGQSLLS